MRDSNEINISKCQHVSDMSGVNWNPKFLPRAASQESNCSVIMKSEAWQSSLCQIYCVPISVKPRLVNINHAFPGL